MRSSWFFFYDIVVNTRHGYLNKMFTDNIMNLSASEIIISLRKVKTLDKHNTRKNVYGHLMIIVIIIVNQRS